MNHKLTPEQTLQIAAENSRRLHDLLAGYEAELRDLEANPTRYTLADYNHHFQAIALLREQTRKAIDESIERDLAMAEAWHERL